MDEEEERQFHHIWDRLYNVCTSAVYYPAVVCHTSQWGGGGGCSATLDLVTGSACLINLYLQRIIIIVLDATIDAETGERKDICRCRTSSSCSSSFPSPFP
jgi:hypothetical protein